MPDLRREIPPKPFLSEVQFNRELDKCDHIDCLTYSISFDVCKLRRVIYVVGRPPRAAKSIQVSGTHAKLWLCYDKADNCQAYVGSANATAMTLFELVYKATTEQTRDLVDYFESLWKLNTPKK